MLHVAAMPNTKDRHATTVAKLARLEKISNFWKKIKKSDFLFKSDFHTPGKQHSQTHVSMPVKTIYTC